MRSCTVVMQEWARQSFFHQSPARDVSSASLQAAKLCNNLVLGITMAAVCEALVLALAAFHHTTSSSSPTCINRSCQGHALAESLGLDQRTGVDKHQKYCSSHLLPFPSKLLRCVTHLPAVSNAGS